MLQSSAPNHQPSYMDSEVRIEFCVQLFQFSALVSSQLFRVINNWTRNYSSPDLKLTHSLIGALIHSLMGHTLWASFCSFPVLTGRMSPQYRPGPQIKQNPLLAHITWAYVASGVRPLIGPTARAIVSWMRESAAMAAARRSSADRPRSSSPAKICKLHMIPNYQVQMRDAVLLKC